MMAAKKTVRRGLTGGGKERVPGDQGCSMLSLKKGKETVMDVFRCGKKTTEPQQPACEKKEKREDFLCSPTVGEKAAALFVRGADVIAGRLAAIRYLKRGIRTARKSLLERGGFFCLGWGKKKGDVTNTLVKCVH